MSIKQTKTQSIVRGLEEIGLVDESNTLFNQSKPLAQSDLSNRSEGDFPIHVSNYLKAFQNEVKDESSNNIG